MNILAILGAGAALYQIFKPKDHVDTLVQQAMPIAQQHIDNGVPVQQAVAIAANKVVGSMPLPPPVTYSSTPTQTTPTGPILSLNDQRIAQAIATAKTGGSFSAMASEISAVGMPLDVRNALIAQGWTWTGSVFSPGGLVPPGVTPIFVKA